MGKFFLHINEIANDIDTTVAASLLPNHGGMSTLVSHINALTILNGWPRKKISYWCSTYDTEMNIKKPTLVNLTKKKNSFNVSHSLGEINILKIARSLELFGCDYFVKQ